MCCRQRGSTVVIFAALVIGCDVSSTLDLSDCGSEDLFVCCLTYLISRPRVYNNNYFTESTKTHPRPHFTRPRHGTLCEQTHTHTCRLVVIWNALLLLRSWHIFFLCSSAPCSCCRCISNTHCTELKMEKTIITPLH